MKEEESTEGKREGAREEGKKEENREGVREKGEMEEEGIGKKPATAHLNFLPRPFHYCPLLC